MASSVLELANAASKIQTVADVRAAMGAVSQVLKSGYDALSFFGASTSVPNLVEGTRAAAFSLLDTVNKSAQSLYNIYTDDPDLQDEEISAWHAIVAGKIIAQANDAVKSVEEATGTNLGNIAQVVNDAIDAEAKILKTVGEGVGSATGKVAQSITNAAGAAVSALWWAAWPTILTVTGGFILYVNRDKVFKFLEGKAKL